MLCLQLFECSRYKASTNYKKEGKNMRQRHIKVREWWKGEYI